MRIATEPSRMLRGQTGPWLLALLVFGVALSVRLLVLPVEAGLAYLSFYPAIVVAFFVLGAGPGWLVAGLSCSAAYWIFTPPHWGFAYDQRGALSVVVFLASALLISRVLARHRSTTDKLEQTRLALQERERLLTEREAFFRRITDSLPLQLAYGDRQGRHRFANLAYCEHFGLPREALLGRTRSELTGNAAADAVLPHLAAALCGQAQRFELDVALAGASHRIESRLIPDLDDLGEVQGFFSIGIDVSDRHQAQQALAASEALLSQTGRVAGVGGWQLDLRTSALTWSAQTRAIHEVPADFVPTLTNAIGFYAPQAQDRITQAVQQAIAQGVGWDLELPLITAKGRAIWVRAVGQVELSQGAPVKLMGAFQDVTARLTLETQLAEAAARTSDLYDHAPCGYYSLDASGRYVRINELALSWLGCARDEVIGKLSPTDFFSDAGRAYFRLMFPTFMADGRVGPLEFELRSRAGSVRWISVSATAIHDADGRFVKSRSVMYDITELHQARDSLRRLSTEQDAMLDNDIVAIVKLRNRVAVWKNRALGRMFGYGPNELLNQPSRMLYADDETYDAVGKAAHAVLGAGGHYRDQFQMRRKNGEMIWVDANAMLLSEETGESMWLMTDITLLKGQQARAEHIALHDALTDLPNRRLLMNRLTQALALAQRDGSGVTVCYLDLDGFKAVNDAQGHEAGDLVLKEVARRLQRCVRGGDTVARLGGDEFVLLLTPVGARPEADGVLRRVIDLVAQPVDLGASDSARVSASIGVAVYPDDGNLPDVLLARADEAMYAAKRKGKNQASHFGDVEG